MPRGGNDPQVEKGLKKKRVRQKRGNREGKRSAVTHDQTSRPGGKKIELAKRGKYSRVRSSRGVNFSNGSSRIRNFIRVRPRKEGARNQCRKVG